MADEVAYVARSAAKHRIKIGDIAFRMHPITRGLHVDGRIAAGLICQEDELSKKNYLDKVKLGPAHTEKSNRRPKPNLQRGLYFPSRLTVAQGYCIVRFQELGFRGAPPLAVTRFRLPKN